MSASKVVYTAHDLQFKANNLCGMVWFRTLRVKQRLFLHTRAWAHSPTHPSTCTATDIIDIYQRTLELLLSVD